MRKNLERWCVALLLIISLPTSSQVMNIDNDDDVCKIDPHAAQYDYIRGQVLVKFTDQQIVQVKKRAGRYAGTNVNSVSTVLAKYDVKKMEQLFPNEKPHRVLRKAPAYNGTVVSEKDLSQLYCVTLDEENYSKAFQLMNDLNSLEEVEFAEPNYKLYTLEDNAFNASHADNPYVNSQWYLDFYGVKQLWNQPVVNPTRPIIAILDTGIDPTHPDLVDNLWTNQKEANGEEGYDNDNNGFVGDVHGWDFINNTALLRDNNMHGTHVAGIAAASNNDIGIIGANPQAYIMPITVMQSDGSGDVATIIKGIDYAITNGAAILNLSLGTYANSRALRQALEKAYQTAIIVAAAGNDKRCINSSHHPEPCYAAAPMFPAAYSFVLGVQATQSDGSLAPFSNYDDDGANFSSVTTLQDPDGFNYELKAPGTDMLSTIPGGKYKILQGTSMASPLVAGAISTLLMVKNYETQEILWGDLLHSNNIAEAFAVKKRPAELNLQRIIFRERKDLAEETEENYNGDGRIDAGETVSLYPVIRTSFGEASNIRMHLEMGDELEDSSAVQILTDTVNFGLHLDAYGKGVSLNPLRLRVKEGVANGRHINMKFIATCDETDIIYEEHFTIVVDNITKIGGTITNNMVLTADHEYAVSKTLLVTNNATLTINPGVTLKFMDYAGIAIDEGAHLVAKGKPDSLIVFTKNDGALGYLTGIKQQKSDTIEYAVIENFIYYDYQYNGLLSGTFKNCIIRNNADYASTGGYPYIFSGVKIINSVCDGNFIHCGLGWSNWEYTNITNNYGDYLYSNDEFAFSNGNDAQNCNIINLTYGGDNIYWAGGGSAIGMYTNEKPNYYGSSLEQIVRKGIWDVERGDCFVYWSPDNMLAAPVSEAHGIVWKVCVNGKDTQDEYEDIAPLGVGKHKFEVYFNRPMNKDVNPQITFGIRDPYNQNAVAEDGVWNEEGTIFTVYKTIDGKTKSDGVNRIRVYGAEDDEFFECPDEKTRFNVLVNAAGSMATGFVAQAGMGRVELTWNNENNDFEDAMGFNIYRYTMDGESQNDTIRINSDIVDTNENTFSDYDVTPGKTYYYYYKVLSTGLQEFDISNVVAATPLTATMGDANGSGEVDVADVITTVNHAAGLEPKPFIFEAADVNADHTIDILDVVGIIQNILNPDIETKARIESTATYTVEEGIVYVETPVALAGVQLQLNISGQSAPTTFDALKGFENASAWLTDEDYLLLAYNMNGKTLTAGKHALLNIGNAQLHNIRLSDVQGHNVLAEAGNATAINMQIPTLGNATNGVYNMNGQKVARSADALQRLPKGIYIVNGLKMAR